jgi:meso-butanediol dehydrogenase/(S,S)-butanediol dehydrogenase/diacetyl reductase
MNRIVIINGATSGIGKAIAEKYLLAADKVLILGRNQGKLEQIGDVYKDKCETYSVDVSNEKSVRDFFWK